MPNSLTAILHNPHFNQYAALLSVAMSPGWRKDHPEVQSVRGTLEMRLSRLVRSYLKDAHNIRNDIVKEFSTLIVSIVEADPKLFYTTDDYDWFIATMDGDESEARFTLSTMFAQAVTSPTWISLEEASGLLGKAQSTLRNDAAAGKIIGAKKINEKSWVFNSLALKAYYNVELPTTLSIEVE